MRPETTKPLNKANVCRNGSNGGLQRQDQFLYRDRPSSFDIARKYWKGQFTKTTSNPFPLRDRPTTMDLEARNDSWRGISIFYRTGNRPQFF